MNKKIRYPSLNGLRAISILGVLISHLSIRHHLFWNSFIDVSQAGAIGVNTFFVISGFLITSLMLEEERNTNTVSLKDFYIRRTLRIFPAYYFLLLVYFVLQIIGLLHIDNSSWLTAITYTKDLHMGISPDWYTIHSWSLSVEEQFYLLWPVVFMLGNNTRKRMVIFLMLSVPLIKLFTHYFPIGRVNDFSIFKRIDAIALGCIIALYKEEILRVIKPYLRTAFFIAVAGLLLLSLQIVLDAKFNSWFDLIIVVLGSTHGTVANLFIGVILLYSVFGPQKTWFRLLNSKVLNYIGLLSYSIYLWQQLFMAGLNNWATSFPQNLVFIFIISLFSYYVIEKPFLTLKDKFQKNNGQQTAQWSKMTVNNEKREGAGLY